VSRALLVVALCLGACGRRDPAPPAPVVHVPAPPLPPVEAPWVATLAAVQTAVDSGRFTLADSILTAFEQSEPGTRDANESAFWRAMLHADARNPAFTPATARAALEAYLGTSPAQRRTEAEVMLRLLTLSDSLRGAQAAQRTAAEQRDRAREEELQKLRDELQRTQAELDRIKRRLGPPKP
jgi:hypothetical protein